MKIVVAYSGGLDTSVILKWIKETYAADVVAFCVSASDATAGAGTCAADDVTRAWAQLKRVRSMPDAKMRPQIKATARAAPNPKRELFMVSVLI